MRWFAICAALIVWTVTAVAAPVDVRTGEHADFTRVVITIPEGSDWQFGRTLAGYALRLPVTEGYALQRFFDLIPRTRIADVEQNVEAGELRLEVNCLCNAHAYLFRPDVMVIDVRDGPPRRFSSSEMSIDPPRPTASTDSVKPIRQPYVIGQLRTLPLLIGDESVPVVAQPLLENSQSIVSEGAITLKETQPTQTKTDDLALLEKSIIEGLGRALTDGFLDGELQPLRLEIERTRESDQNIANTGLGFPGMVARTSVDQMAVTPPDTLGQTQTGQICVPDSFFDVASWGDDRVFFDQLNDARRALVPEFEDTDPEAVISLAKLYVHFGFGREAEQALGLDQAQSQARRYLRALARIVDDRLPTPGLFEEQVSCPGQVALWSMLALQQGPFDGQVDVQAVLRTFRQLPKTLQVALGPRLSKRLLRIGAEDAALQVINTTSSDAVDAIDRVLANASLLQALGEQREAVAAVADAVRRDPRATPELMVRFFQDGTKTGLPFSDNDFTLLDAMRFEQSGTSIAPKLAVAQIEGYSSVGRFEDALSLLLQTAPNIDPMLKSKLLDDIFVDASEQMREVQFLRFAIQQDGDVLGAMARNSVATRLLKMGFPSLAQSFLNGPDGDEEGAHQRYLTAQAAVALGEPKRAIEALREKSTVRAQQIQAVAEAEAQMQALFFQPQAAVTLELSNTSDDQELREFAQQAQEPELRVLNPQQPLTQSRALLERSANSRALLESLLARSEMPEDF